MIGKFKFSKFLKINHRNFLLNQTNHFSSLTNEKTEIISNDTSVQLLNNYLKESLIAINKGNLQDSQIKIIESISNQKSHSMILCDDFSGRKSSCALGIMNRVMQGVDFESRHTSEELFVDPKETFKKYKEKSKENLEKKNLKPRGALVICQKFEFATNLYRICRKLDFQNKLRMVRVGTSLHTVSPTVDLDGKKSSDSEDVQTQESILGNLNLINTTEWKNIDILFVTPHILEYVFSQKDQFDYFDINPELIMIDDFDYILNSEKYDIKELLARFFSPNSLFKSEFLNNRKLVLTSSTVPVENLLFQTNSSLDNFSKAVEFYKNYLKRINNNFSQKLEIIMSQYFMDLDYHLKGIKVNLKVFDGEGKILLDKKIKHLQHLIDHEKGKIVICCSESTISLLRDHFRKKRLKFVSIDESERICARLFSFVCFNKYENDLLFITPIFLKSLNFPKVNHIILFDFVSDNNDLIRILSKFPKTHHDERLHLLCSFSEQEKNEQVINNITKHNKSN